MKVWRERGSPHFISKALWWVAHRVWSVGNALSHLGTFLSFGPRPDRKDYPGPRPDRKDYPGYWEATVGFPAESEEEADAVWMKLTETACGCNDGWCVRGGASSLRRVFDEERELDDAP